jgi:hypothetical protein
MEQAIDLWKIGKPGFKTIPVEMGKEKVAVFIVLIGSNFKLLQYTTALYLDIVLLGVLL